MSEALYNEAIMTEAKAAVGAGRLAAPSVSVRCDNPLCGDRITLDLVVENGRIEEVGHVTRGCLLTNAAASIIARHVGGQTPSALAQARRAAETVLAGGAPPADWPELAMFEPVSAVRSRHLCVLLPFKALDQALEQHEARVGS